MKYCADTWFVLSLFHEEPRAMRILRDTKEGKSRLVFPVVVLAESIRKLSQRGVDEATIDLFWSGAMSSEKTEIAVADRAVAKEAARIAVSYGLPLIDAFVAATSRLAGCDLLLAADTDYSILVKKKYLKAQSW